jgi:hypothetical protein
MSVETTTYCARHPKEATVVRCATCGIPICTKCMVFTPVGTKCRSCASNKQSPLYQVRPERFVLACVASLLAGVGAAFLAGIGFFVIFLGTAYGYFAGSIILRASGMKRGLKMEITAGAGMVIGALATHSVPTLTLLAAHASTTSIFTVWILDPFFWLALVISTACAVSKIRYL